MWFLVFVVVLVGCPTPLTATDFYVATDGNDQWSGRWAAPTAANTDGPFATLQQARDEIRRQRQAGRLKDEVTVNVRDGAYTLPNGLKFEAQDGGSATAPVAYRAYENEHPILIGGRPITRFAVFKGQILQADTAAEGLKGVYFRQLFFDGERQTLARYPNCNREDRYYSGWAYADGTVVPWWATVPDEDKCSFTVKSQDLRTWKHPEEVQVCVFPRYNWLNDFCQVKLLDPSTRRLTLAGEASSAIRPGDRYFFQNALEELDAPGEWYLDKETSTLYFWPPTPLDGKAVFVPTTRTILDLRPGTAYLTVRGFTLSCAEGTAVVLNDTTHCLVAGNTIRNVGDYNGCGVSVNGGSNNGVVGNDISEIGCHGILIGGGDLVTLTPAGNYADNNYIHHIGVFYKHGVGIKLMGVGNRAAHNLIHDGPRIGIWFLGNDLVIEYNHIRHMCLETRDAGAVYTCEANWLSARGSVVRFNYIHDMLGYGRDDNGRWISPEDTYGIYLDDGTSGVDIIGNILARCPMGGVHLHSGRDNHIENNIFIENAGQQFRFTGWLADSSTWKAYLPAMTKGFERVADPCLAGHAGDGPATSKRRSSRREDHGWK